MGGAVSSVWHSRPDRPRSRPHHSPRQAAFSLLEKVLVLRRGHMPGYEIARRTGLSPASVSRILRRARLSRWRDLNPPPPVQRYEHPRPGDLLHLDIKGMTQFGEVSLRGDGRLRGKRSHPGFLALHVAVDDHSRMAFTQMLPDQKAETTIGFLNSAIEFFSRHGIGIRALLTDNGSSYRSHQFRHACQQMQISTATPALTRHEPMGRPNASSRPPCANGHTQNTGPTRWKEMLTSSPGSTTTTENGPMVASTTSRPSAAPIQEQPPDHLQAPGVMWIEGELLPLHKLIFLSFLVCASYRAEIALYKFCISFWATNERGGPLFSVGCFTPSKSCQWCNSLINVTA